MLSPINFIHYIWTFSFRFPLSREICRMLIISDSIIVSQPSLHYRLRHPVGFPKVQKLLKFFSQNTSHSKKMIFWQEYGQDFWPINFHHMFRIQKGWLPKAKIKYCQRHNGPRDWVLKFELALQLECKFSRKENSS